MPVGTKLTYTITYRNDGAQTVTVYPRMSNLGAVAVEGTRGNCRWANLAPGAEGRCTTAVHVVLADDVATGFTPEVTVDLTRDRNGAEVLAAGIVVRGDRVSVQPAPPHPSETAQPVVTGEKRRLAERGLAGYACHRIPALTEAPNGWLIAAWDGRPETCQDAPQANSIIGRISRDGGQTWTTPITIAAGDAGSPKFGYSDPSFVTDRETGEIFVFFVKSFDAGIFHSRAGVDPQDRAVLHAAVASSTDNGLTWSSPRVITADISDPQTHLGRFATSGEGIQLRYGPHRGRLVQQFVVNVGPGLAMRAMSVYSDDHGRTWQRGELVGSPLDAQHGTGLDENKVVELSDGTLMLNSRTTLRDVRARLVAYSTDGGLSYTPAVADQTLIDPHNNASIIRAYPGAPQGSECARILLFSNAATTSGRTTGTIRVSYDDGRTWSAGTVFEAGPMQYSTLTPLAAPGQYGLLFEGEVEGSPSIEFMRVDMAWLGQDTGCPAADPDPADGDAADGAEGSDGAEGAGGADGAEETGGADGAAEVGGADGTAGVDRAPATGSDAADGRDAGVERDGGPGIPGASGSDARAGAGNAATADRAGTGAPGSGAAEAVAPRERGAQRSLAVTGGGPAAAAVAAAAAGAVLVAGVALLLSRVRRGRQAAGEG